YHDPPFWTMGIAKGHRSSPISRMHRSLLACSMWFDSLKRSANSVTSFCPCTGSGFLMSSMAGPKMAASALESRLLTAVERARTASADDLKVLPLVAPFMHQAGASHRRTAAAALDDK